jgi:hypothetical protein
VSDETPAFGYVSRQQAIREHYGIVADGEHDDTEAIQRMLDDGFTMKDLGPGRFHLSSSLRLRRDGGQW